MIEMCQYIKEWNQKPENWTNNRRKYNGMKPRRKEFNKSHKGYINESLGELFIILADAIMKGKING